MSDWQNSRPEIILTAGERIEAGDHVSINEQGLAVKARVLRVAAVCSTFRRNVTEGDAGLARPDAPEMLCRDAACPIHVTAPATPAPCVTCGEPPHDPQRFHDYKPAPPAPVCDCICHLPACLACDCAVAHSPAPPARMSEEEWQQNIHWSEEALRCLYGSETVPFGTWYLELREEARRAREAEGLNAWDLAREKMVSASKDAEIAALREQRESASLACLEEKRRADTLREALESIAANTCCDKCQEAALVARAALARKGSK